MEEEKIDLKQEKTEEVKETPKVEIEQNTELITKQELEETTDRLKRVMAEFENYKKRASKEREFLYNAVLSDIISSFLPMIDNLEKALEMKTEDEKYKEGIELIVKQLHEILTKFNVKAIESVGKQFDPELHEAISSVQDDMLGEKIIKAEYRKGYTIGNKVIRHAMVVVAN